jgi:tetratricopeptide (TPR) repeat protein
VKTSIHLSRANGYRELGMFDESILELESIRQEDVWSYDVIQSKYLTYFEAKQFEMASAMTHALRIHHSHLNEGWLLWAECIFHSEGPSAAANLLIDKSETVGNEADVLFSIGRFLAMAEDFSNAKNYIRRAIKLNHKYRKAFLEDPVFDGLWESFA